MGLSGIRQQGGSARVRGQQRRLRRSRVVASSLLLGVSAWAAVSQRAGASPWGVWLWAVVTAVAVIDVTLQLVELRLLRFAEAGEAHAPPPDPLGIVAEGRDEFVRQLRLLCAAETAALERQREASTDEETQLVLAAQIDAIRQRYRLMEERSAESLF